MKTTSISKALVVAVALLHTAPLLAQQSVPAYISYQGFARDAQNEPLDGTGFRMTFRIWSDYEASDKDKYLVWSEEQEVDVHEGSFSVLLGKGGDAGQGHGELVDVFADNQELYLGVTIDIPGGPEETEIKPRLRFLSSPFSFVAQRAILAETVQAGAIKEASIDESAVTENKISDDAVTSDKIANDAVTSDEISDDAVTSHKIADDVGVWTKQGQNLVSGTGKVGIGVADPEAMLHVKGNNEMLLRLEGVMDKAKSYRWDIEVQSTGSHLGNVNFYLNGGHKAAVRATDGSWYHVSDGRLKKDIAPLNAVLHQVRRLRPVCYRWNTSPEGAPKSLGFIAQEVKPLFPSAIDEQNGTLMMSSGALIPVAIGAIQELDSKVEEDNQALRRENADLRARLDRLETLVERLAEETHPRVKPPTTANVSGGAE